MTPPCRKVPAMNDDSQDAYPYVTVGEPMVLTLMNGLTLHGRAVDLHLGADGELTCVRLHPEGEEPIAVNVAQIALWRRGEPLRQVPQTIMVPAAVPNGPGPGPVPIR